MIIGLSGYARSGKDEIAKILVEEYGFTRVAFADKIRGLLYEMNPNYHDTLLQQAVDRHGWDEVKKDPTVRRMLQTLGVGARKLFGPQFWVHEAMKTMLNEPRLDLNYVITDVRFLNEVDMIKSNNGEIWRVVRPGVTAVNDHISEHELDNYEEDALVLNEGTIEELQQMIRYRMDSFLANKTN